MASDWNTAMQERFDRLRDELTAVIAARTAAITADVTAAVTPAVTAAVTEAVTASVNAAFAAHAAALSRQADENLRRLTEAFQVGMEALHAHVRLAAETWGASIEALQRTVDEMNARLGARLTDHDAVLTNHATRLKRLEHRRRRA